jgi:membrane complex biogenesis BtpA family protein
MFNRKCSLIGVVHVLPLPGSAGYSGNMEEIVRLALDDAGKYKEGGLDAIMIENMHDVPYLKGYVEPETTAAMAVVAKVIREKTKLPMGVQLLAGANIESLAVALAASLDFIRVEGFVFAHVGDEGIHESCAAKLIRRRAQLKAEHLKIFADIKKKHSSHAITEDVSLIETARAAEFFKADGVIVTGSATGEAPPPESVRGVAAGCGVPVLVGSGVTPENIEQFLPSVNGLIVGSALKYDGQWDKHVDPARVAALVKRVEDLSPARL